MAEIRNSKRTLHQATYSPIEVKESPKTIRAWEKWSFFASLLPTIADFPGLLTRLRRKVPRTDDAAERQRLAEALAAGEALNALVPKIGTPSALATVKVFRNISAEALLTLGREHHAAEERRVKSLLDAHGELEQAYLAAQKTPEPAAEIKVPEGYELVPGGRDFDIYRLEKVERAAGGTTAPAAPVPFDPTGAAGEPAEGEEVEEDRIAGEARTVRLLAIPRAKPLPPAPVEASLELRPSAVAVARWALEKEMRPAEARQLLEVAEHYDTVNQPLEIASILEIQLSNIGQLLEGFETRMKVEPIGFLHLERLSFTPAGVERGEMVSSIPLSPGEEVNFTHREWSNTSQEFEKLTTDYMESFSEQGVTEKSELAEAKSNQTQHSSGYNTGVSVSGGYGPVKIASSFNYNVQDSASSASEESRRSSQEITNKASSRSKREHKTSFRIASAAGTEDESVRRIKNPDLVNPMRVDYYRLIRKWRVDLERYGLRLTYDITIPEPGSDVLTRHLEIRELKKKVTEDFSFSLSPSQITRLSYHGLAAQYQASVEAPPPEEILYTAHDEANFPDYDAAKRSEFHALEFNVDERYTVSKVETFDNYFHFTSGGSTKGSPKLWWEIDQAELLGTTGKVSAVYLTDDLASYFVFVKVTAKLLPEEFKEWQLEAWKSLYDAAESAFLANQQRYQNRITELEKEVEEDDALSLRKIEREEVMKGVLRWLFGPTFRFVPAGLPSGPQGLKLYGSSQQVASEQIWTKMLAHGEFIKFLHNAIEWENMLYFLYPYFWTHPDEWDDRMYLDHSDAIHRQFLKAGCARVVVTIRPKFEDSFLALIETGDFQSLPASHPYVSIATEMKNYANTNYPGIPSANPAKHGGAWRQIQLFSGALEDFYADCGRYPSTTEGLAALLTDPGSVTGWDGPYTTSVPKDPWGNAYVYESPGEHGGFDIVSYGADGQQGGSDDDADVVSWAEGSLMGTWIEYMPTGALDISIGDELPEG